MKLIINQLCAVGLAGLLLFSCKNEKPAPANPGEKPAAPAMSTENVLADPTAGTPFKITEGTVSWMGSTATGKQHTGTLKLGAGNIQVKDGKIVGGEIALDMASIAVTDLEGEKKADLESHLKDTDFFETQKFPSGSFKITEIMAGQDKNFNTILTGDLTLKGVTKSVNIPVNLKIEGKTLTASTPTFPLNRTDFGINYKSSLLEKAKDKLINDNVMVSLTLTAGE